MDTSLDFLSATLDLLISDIRGGKVTLTQARGLPNNYEAKKWRGLHNVVVRYDCVNFWLDQNYDVEARVGRLPGALADKVLRLWHLVGPDTAYAKQVWAVVRESLETE